MSDAGLLVKDARGVGLSNARVLAPWYIIEFWNSYACTLLLVCTPYFIKECYGLGPGYALWQSAGWGLMYVPFALLAGVLADRWGPRTLVVRAASLGVPAAALGLAAVGVHSVWLLFAVLVVFNLANTSVWPALEAAITRSPGTVKLSTRTGIYNVIWSSAGFLAFVTGDLVRTLGWESLFLLPTGMCVIGAVAAKWWTIPQAMLTDVEAPDDETHGVPPANAPSLLKMAWVGNPMAYVAINVLMAVMPAVSPHAISLGAVWKATTVAGFFLWWKWRGWHYRTGLMLLAYGGLVGSFVAMVGMAGGADGTPVWVFLPAQVVFGLSVSLIYSSSLYYAMHVSSGGGSHAGIHEALIGGGIGLGCMVGALASGATTLLPVVLAVGGILVVGGGIVVTLAAKSPKVKSE